MCQTQRLDQFKSKNICGSEDWGKPNNWEKKKINTCLMKSDKGITIFNYWPLVATCCCEGPRQGVDLYLYLCTTRIWREYLNHLLAS